MLSKAISAKTGVSKDAVIMACVLFSLLPLSFIYDKLLPKKAYFQRTAVSIIISSTLYLFNFDASLFYHIIASTVYTYILTQSRTVSPWSIFVINFAHLAWIQWGATQYFTGAFMMVVVKNTMYAWDTDSGTVGHWDKIAKQHIRYGLQEYLGYIFFFPTFFVGPPFSFKYYTKCIYAENRPLATRKAATKCIIWAGAILSLVITLSPYSYDNALLPEYRNKSYMQRFLLLQLYGFSSRMRYYFAWKMAEGCALFAGVGFDIAENGDVSYKSVRSADVLSTEFAGNIRTTLNKWNMMTAYWLHDYVYENLMKQDERLKKHSLSKGAATYMTFIISAFWHGIHPGYYLTFASGAFFTSTARKMRKRFSPYITRQNMAVRILYNIAAWAITWTAINYTCAPFMVFTFAKGMDIWKQNYFIFHILAGIANLVL